MPMPTKEKIWQVHPNLSPASTSIPDLLATVCAQFTTFSSPWIVRQCGYYNGSTIVVTTDGVNHFATASKLRWSASPGDYYRSWIVYRNSLLGYDILFDLISGYSYYYSMFFGYSKNGYLLNGTPTSRPTASDEVPFSPNYTQWTNTSAGTNKVHAMHSTDGGSTRIFVHRAGSKITTFLFEHLQDRPSLAVDPFVIYANYGMYYPSLLWEDIRLRNMFSGKANNISYDGALATEHCYTSSGDYPLVQQFSGAVNSFTGNYGMSPVWVYSYKQGARGRMGRIADMYVTSQALTEGDTYPVAQPDWVNFGSFAHPWDGITIPQTT